MARAAFEQADEALGFSISDLCWHGPEQDLQLTANTQPAILATSIAILRVLEDAGISAQAMAGHSLGEYSALVAAGALSFADALVLVRRRGELMQKAVPVGEGAMAAILGLDAESVAEVTRSASGDQVCAVANLNAPTQIVIAGHKEAVERAVDLAKERWSPPSCDVASFRAFSLAADGTGQGGSHSRLGVGPILGSVGSRDHECRCRSDREWRRGTPGTDSSDRQPRPLGRVDGEHGVRRLDRYVCRSRAGFGAYRSDAPYRFWHADRESRGAGGNGEAAVEDGRSRIAVFSLDGKTALVTGASQGIGAAIATTLSRSGARVILAARSVEKLESLANELGESGGDACVLQLDLGETDGIAARLKDLPEDFQGIDILVNNAGITADNIFIRMKQDEWDRVMRVNLTGAFAITRAVARGMMKRRWGRIISVSSVVGLMGNAGQVNYGAAKAGLVGFTKSLARELAPREVTANVVAPGFIETAMTDSIPEKSKEQLFEAIPLKRLGTVEDIAAAVLYLASEEAGYVTGHVLNVSGGLYI